MKKPRKCTCTHKISFFKPNIERQKWELTYLWRCQWAWRRWQPRWRWPRSCWWCSTTCRTASRCQQKRLDYKLIHSTHHAHLSHALDLLFSPPAKSFAPHKIFILPSEEIFICGGRRRDANILCHTDGIFNQKCSRRFFLSPHQIYCFYFCNKSL